MELDLKSIEFPCTAPYGIGTVNDLASRDRIAETRFK